MLGVLGVFGGAFIIPLYNGVGFSRGLPSKCCSLSSNSVSIDRNRLSSNTSSSPKNGTSSLIVKIGFRFKTWKLYKFNIFRFTMQYSTVSVDRLSLGALDNCILFVFGSKSNRVCAESTVQMRKTTNISNGCSFLSTLHFDLYTLPPNLLQLCLLGSTTSKYNNNTIIDARYSLQCAILFNAFLALFSLSHLHFYFQSIRTNLNSTDRNVGAVMCTDIHETRAITTNTSCSRLFPYSRALYAIVSVHIVSRANNVFSHLFAIKLCDWCARAPRYRFLSLNHKWFFLPVAYNFCGIFFFNQLTKWVEFISCTYA